MRILFLSNLYPPHDLGGMELRCQETANRLTEHDYVCHVLTSRHGVNGSPPSEEGVTRALYLEADIHYYRPLDFFLRRPRQERSNRRALRSALDDFQPDIVFVWGMWNLSQQIAYWAERWMPDRVTYAVAGYWPMEPNVHEAYWQQPAHRAWTRTLMAPSRWLALRTLDRERKTYPLALEHVACVSRYVRNRLSGAGALVHGAQVIYNGIDPQPYLAASSSRTTHKDGLRLVYTGGLVTHKGVITAIEALGLLRQRDELGGIHLTLIGDGHPEYVAHLKRRVEELVLGEHVTFQGRVPREEIAFILSSQDMFLFTSIYEEPIARTVMEAMAAGLAVIGTSVGGQREMLENDVNALVYPPDDAAALAKCILRLRNDPDLRLRLASSGRQTVLDRFTLDRMVDEMEAWLKEIAA